MTRIVIELPLDRKDDEFGYVRTLNEIRSDAGRSYTVEGSDGKTRQFSAHGANKKKLQAKITDVINRSINIEGEPWQIVYIAVDFFVNGSRDYDNVFAVLKYVNDCLGLPNQHNLYGVGLLRSDSLASCSNGRQFQVVANYFPPLYQRSDGKTIEHLRLVLSDRPLYEVRAIEKDADTFVCRAQEMNRFVVRSQRKRKWSKPRKAKAKCTSRSASRTS